MLLLKSFHVSRSQHAVRSGRCVLERRQRTRNLIAVGGLTEQQVAELLRIMVGDKGTRQRLLPRSGC